MSGSHLQACGRSLKGAFWNSLGWFLASRLPFLLPVYSVWLWPFAACRVLPLQACLYSLGVNDVVLISGGVFFYPNGGCLMSSKCFSEDAYCIRQVMRSVMCSRKLSRRALSHSTDSKVREGQRVLWKKTTFSVQAWVKMTQDQELNFCQPT